MWITYTRWRSCKQFTERNDETRDKLFAQCFLKYLGQTQYPVDVAYFAAFNRPFDNCGLSGV